MNSQNTINYLKGSYLFSELSTEDIQHISRFTFLRKLPKNTVFIEEGQEGFEAFLIISGLTKVYRIDTEGKEIHITFRTQGEIVGELALLDGMPRSAHVKTLQESLLLVIPKREFVQLVRTKPSIALAIIKTLAKRIRENAAHDSSTQKLSERMLQLLYTITKFFPNQAITLSHEELASIIGASRPRVTQALNILEKNKKIALSYGKVRVLPIVT